MRISFYYHLDVAVDNGIIYVPSLLGVFIDNLAVNVDHLYYIAHTSKYDPRVHDYPLGSKNITLVDLGEKKNSIHRLLFGCNALNDAVKKCNSDILLIRAPSPLAPSIYRIFRKKMVVSFLLVGDYSTLEVPLLSVSKLLYIVYEFIMNKFILSRCNVLVNSRSLLEKYSKICLSASEVRTTTLSERDFYHRDDTCLGEIIHLLYVGRFDWNKGFKELFKAVQILISQGRKVLLHLVGWDDNLQKLNQMQMETMIKELNIEEYVIFEGKKNIGASLNDMYRRSDIFILPSYSEGMPRCIWEAMANGVPVVTTDVGGIPYNLENKKDALIIKPHDTNAIVNSVISIMDDPNQRRLLINSGYKQASNSTLNICNQKIINILSQQID